MMQRFLAWYGTMKPAWMMFWIYAFMLLWAAMMEMGKW